MNVINSPPLETSLSPFPSSMSEGDTFSDSDWLDLSSNRESDDNDSVVSADSDRDETGLIPLSRRSSLSTTSSREGDIDAWEGFVEESGDEDVRNAAPSMVISEPITAGLVEVTAAGASDTVLDTEHDPAEEQRVKDALDQSLISTLSTSRTSSASAHTSIRDLRLSFPDPLTRSQDELNRSYESVSQSESAFTPTDVPTDAVSDVDNIITEKPHPVKEDSVSDLSALAPVPKMSQPTYAYTRYDGSADFEVVLYGSSSPIKWSLIHDLMSKAASASGLTLAHLTYVNDHLTQDYLFERSPECPSSDVAYSISVHDRTENVINNNRLVTERPSLAILYLPSNIKALPEHTLYLPVLLPPASATDKFHYVKARNTWDILSIPENKVARLGLDTGPSIFDSGNVDEVEDMHVRRLFQRLLLESKKRSRESWSNPLNPRHAVTLFALLSLIVGFAMNTAFRRSPTPTSTISSTTSGLATFWGIFGPDLNQTSIINTASKATEPPLTTLKGFSLSIYTPGATSLSVKFNERSLSASTSTVAPKDVSKRPKRTGQAQSAKDVIVRPGTQLSADPQPSMAASSASVFSELTQSSSSSSSSSELKSSPLAQVVDSLSGVLDERVSRFRSDFDELMESLDDLSAAIRMATRKRVNMSKRKARQIQERVQYRHNRARGRAKELRSKGQQILYSAGEQFIESTHKAKKRARDISKELANSDSWRAYQKVHAEWVAKLREKGNEGSRVGGCADAKATRCSSKNFFTWSYAELYLA